MVADGQTTGGEIDAQVIDVISSHCEIDIASITRDTPLESLKVDSFLLVGIVMDLEDRFGIEIDMNATEAWENLSIVGDILDMVTDLTNPRS